MTQKPDHWFQIQMARMASTKLCTTWSCDAAEAAYLEKAIVEVQADHLARGLDDAQHSVVRWPPHLVLHIAIGLGLELTCEVDFTRNTYFTNESFKFYRKSPHKGERFHIEASDPGVVKGYCDTSVPFKQCSHQPVHVATRCKRYLSRYRSPRHRTCSAPSARRASPSPPPARGHAMSAWS